MKCIQLWIAGLCLCWATSSFAQITCDTSNAIPEPIDSFTLSLASTGTGQNWVLPSTVLVSDKHGEASGLPLHRINPSVFHGQHPFNVPTADMVEFDSLIVSVQGNNMLRIGSYIAEDDASGSLTIGNTLYTNMERVHIREEYFYLIPPELIFPVGEEGEDERFVFIADCYYWYQPNTTTPLLTYEVLTEQFGPVKYRYKYLQASSSPKPSGIEGVKLAPAFACIPNPAQNSVTITYTLPEAADISVCIQDISGKKYILLPNIYQAGGTHTFEADLGSFATGHYIVTLQAGQRLFSQKLVIKK